MKPIFSGLICFVLSGMLIGQTGQFLEAPQYPTGMNPQTLVVADFNGDGILDLAVANSADNTVSVLLGKGNGIFSPKTDYATGSAPQGIAVGDFNGDGHIDIAVSNWSSNSVSILMGEGDGTFQAKVDYVTGRGPQGVAVGDFNGDGRLDLAVTNSSDGTVGVLLNNGNGTFGAQALYNTGTNPLAVAAANLGNNGILDLVVANAGSNTISVLMGNGQGTFQAQTQYATGNTPVSMALADLNGDGNLDVAVADQQGKAVSILLGEGNGAFQNHVEYTTGGLPSAVAVGDFNGDGKLDLAVSVVGGNSVSVLWGVGDGTFKGYVNCGTGDNPAAVVAGDFNNDGTPDLGVANANNNSVSVILSNKNKTFQARMDYPGGPPPVVASAPAPYLIATGDFNGDGNADLAMVDSNCPNFPSCGAGTIAILLGNGDGTFQGARQYSPGTNSDPDSVAVGDFNGDNIPDLAVANYATNRVSIMLGVGDGTFQPAVAFQVGSGPTSVATADVNGDGKLDLVVTNFNSNTVSVLLGNGDGTFGAAASYKTGNGPEAVAVGDFNGDKKLDLVVVNETDSSISILLGNGDGTFQSQMTYLTGTEANSAVAVGDFNGDRKLDLAVADSPSGQMSVLLGNGDGTFQPFKTYAVGTNPFSIVAADFNGDGKLDLALTSPLVQNTPGDVVSVLMGNGDGTFGTPTLFGVGYLSYAAVAGDFNASGTQDLIVANGGGDTISVLLNAQGTAIHGVSSSNPSAFGQSITVTTSVEASASYGTWPTGSVTVKNGNTVLGTGVLIGGQFAVSTAGLAVGTSTLTAVYSGDKNFQPHTVEFNQTVQKAGTGTVLLSSGNPSNPGQAITLTATVTADTSGTPTGTMTFFDGTATIGSSAVSSGGVATLSISTLSTATHTITASYSGDGNFNSSVSPVLSQVVQKVNTATALSSTTTSANLNQTVTFTATVTGSSAGAPTGSVAFLDGSTQIGASAVSGGGVATFSTSTLSAGDHTISASYSGDNNFNGSNSEAMGLTVTAPGFSVSASTLSPSSVAPGSLAKATITVTTFGGLDPSTLALSCTVTPVVSPAATCSMAGTSVASNTVTSTLTVSTVGPQTALASPSPERGSGLRLALGMMIPSMLLSVSGLKKPRGRKLLSFCLLLLVLSGCLIGVACGGGGQAVAPAGNSGTPAGTYTVMVTASGGGTTHTASVSLSVQ